MRELRPHEELVGEPITRDDGRPVRLIKNQTGVHIEVGEDDAFYTDSEVEEIGGGSFDIGLMRLGRFGVAGVVKSDTDKPYLEVIDKSTNLQIPNLNQNRVWRKSGYYS